ncbi:MAG: hypothetical protein K2H41_03260, partial [Acetatifactor sp.]|nr:hypothetical protein [Acetatifactor sp.]
ELLYYMEHTSEENAKTEDLQRLHEMVTAVKRDRKVGLTYMKSFEIEQRIRREGFDEGKTQGMTQGKIDYILDLLGDLGDIPSSLKERITTQEDETILRAWHKVAAKAESIEEFLAFIES